MALGHKSITIIHTLYFLDTKELHFIPQELKFIYNLDELKLKEQ